jgi:molybdate transport system permease protein
VNADASPGIPRAVLALALAGAAFVLLPIVGLAARAPWSDLGTVLTRETTTKALVLSLVVSLSAAMLCMLAGVPLGLALARARLPGRAVVRALVMLPLVAPPVVGGVALLSAFGRRGIVGRGLAHLGVSLPFTAGGAIVAATFVAMPLVIIAVEGGLRSRGVELEEAAETLGASPWLTLRAVTLPLLRPQIVAAFVIAWARALGEFGATITFAGNVSGRTQTLPLAVFETLQTDPGAAIMLSVLLMGVSLTTLVALRGRLFAS